MDVPGVYAIHLKFGSGVLLRMDPYRWTFLFVINGGLWFFLGVALGALGASSRAIGISLAVIYFLLAAAAIPFLAYAVG